MTNHVPRQDSSESGPGWEAIARFLAGESPAAEVEVVQRWLNEHPADRALVDMLAAPSDIEGSDAGDVDAESALAAVKARLNTARVSAVPVIELRPRGSAAVPRHRVLAGMALVAAAAVVVAVVSVRRGPALGGPTAAAPRTYATAVGRRDSVTLADGSRVILGPDSHLIVPADYGVDARHVELAGDGYFDVRHDTTKPFVVHAGQAVIEDIGTTFTVESDDADTTTVSVLAGSVRLHASSAPGSRGAVLAAGDRGAASGTSVVAYPRSATADDAAWTTGRLVFRDASLAQVAGDIRRWYGINVRVVDSSLLSRHVTASFSGESADRVLQIIGLTLGARIERQGDSAMMYASRSPIAPR